MFNSVAGILNVGSLNLPEFTINGTDPIDENIKSYIEKDGGKVRQEDGRLIIEGPFTHSPDKFHAFMKTLDEKKQTSKKSQELQFSGLKPGFLNKPASSTKPKLGS